MTEIGPRGQTPCQPAANISIILCIFTSPWTYIMYWQPMFHYAFTDQVIKLYQNQRKYIIDSQYLHLVCSKVAWAEPVSAKCTLLYNKKGSQLPRGVHLPHLYEHQVIS